MGDGSGDWYTRGSRERPRVVGPRVHVGPARRVVARGRPGVAGAQRPPRLRLFPPEPWRGGAAHVLAGSAAHSEGSQGYGSDPRVRRSVRRAIHDQRPQGVLRPAGSRVQRRDGAGHIRAQRLASADTSPRTSHRGSLAPSVRGDGPPGVLPRSNHGVQVRVHGPLLVWLLRREPHTHEQAAGANTGGL